MKDEGWTVGDTIPTEFATVGKAPLVIGGTFSENSLIGTNYVVSLDTYERYFQQQLDAFVMVKLEPGADATAVTASVDAATEGVRQHRGPGSDGLPRSAGGIHRSAPRL